MNEYKLYCHKALSIKRGNGPDLATGSSLLTPVLIYEHVLKSFPILLSVKSGSLGTIFCYLLPCLIIPSSYFCSALCNNCFVFLLRVSDWVKPSETRD